MKEPSPLYHAIRHAAPCRILPRLFLKNARPLQAASGRFLPGFLLEKNGPRLATATNRIQARVLPARFLAPGKRQFGKTTHRRPKSRRIARGRVLGHRRHKGLRFGVFPDQFIERERKRILEKAGRRNRRALLMRKQENRVRNVKPRCHAAKASNETVIVSPLPNKRGIAYRGRRADGPALAEKKRCEVQAAHNATARIEIMT